MQNADGSVIINTRINTDGFNTGIDKIKGGLSGISSAAKKLTGVLATVFAVKQIVQFGKESIELGSDLAEVQNVVDVTFESMSEGVNEFARNAIAQFGLSETSAKQYASTMGAMLKSMGFTVGEAKDMSTTLAGLAGDLASFYNLSSEEAFAKIRSGISGETEPLKQLGINLNVANLEHYALTQGINKSYSAMTQQEQALLRYNYLLSFTSDAQGDFSRTSEGWANQTRILSEQFNSLKATLGQGLINIFTPVIKVLNTLISRLQVAANAFKSFTEAITGNKQEEFTSGNKALADSYDATTEATEEAEKAQKGFLAGLDEIRTFSEGNSESGQAPSVGFGAQTQDPLHTVDNTGIRETSSIIDLISEQVKKLAAQLKKLVNLFKGGFAEGLGDFKSAFGGIYASIMSIGESLKNIFTSPEIGSAAKSFSESLALSLGRVAGSFGQIGMTIAQNIIGGFQSFLSANASRISEFAASVFDIGSRISDAAGTFSTAFADVFSVYGSESAQSLTGNIMSIFAESQMGMVEYAGNNVAAVVERIVQTFNENRGRLKASLSGTLVGFETATAAIKDHISYLTSTVLPNMNAAFTSSLELLTPFKDFLVNVFFSAWNDILNPAIAHVGDAVHQASGVFQNLWENVLVPFGQFMGDILSPAIEGISFAFGLLWENVLAPLGQFISEVFFAAWEAICTMWDNVLLPIVSKIIEIFQFLWDNVGRPIVSWIKENLWPVIEKVFSNIKGVIDGIKNVFVGLLNFVTSIFSGDWGRAWESIKKIFSGIWDTLVNVVKAPINLIIGLINGLVGGIVAGLNAMIGALNKLSFEVPDWVPLIGGQTLGFNIPKLTAPQIPYLAQGAVIPPNAPFAAVLGDQHHGTNIEAPLDTIKAAVRDVLRENGGAGSENTYRFTAQIGRRVLFDEVITEAKLRKAATGRDPFALA